MEIPLTCPECLAGDYKEFRFRIPQQNDPVYTVSCPEGHEFEMTLLYHPFQKLFEIAVFALADGYFREATGSFAASMERFMELFIRLVNESRGQSSDYFDPTWNLMSRQSERQLGAYIFAHWMEFQKPPELVGNPQTNLRNRVIHQGYIPTREEAIRYGNSVMKCVISTLSEVGNSPELKNKLIGSINWYWDSEPRFTHMPYHMIPTNTPLENARTSVEDLLTYVYDWRTKS